MADFHNVARGLLGAEANEEEVRDFKQKLIMGYPEEGKKATGVWKVIRFLQEEVEPHRSELSQDEMIRVYDAARGKLIELTGGITGFLNPEGGKKKG